MFRAEIEKNEMDFKSSPFFFFARLAILDLLAPLKGIGNHM
jgi:hypothetical protein